MTVIVKGIDVPRGCADCILCDGLCQLWQEYSDDDRERKRHPKCPIREVKTSHGPLIDGHQKVTWQTYDDEHEEFITHKNTILDFLTFVDEQIEMVIPAEGEDA